ncbi:GAF domain-containing protein [Alteribacillus sp. JSM 102045]|uniref:GAF domain-containing protein n=1 Tax=Alteribacillus sp. JSM 102045 TaxID=1562101 RepID=UPI0035C1C34D
MKQPSELILEVVKTYASFLEVNIAVTDRDGQWLITEKGNNPLCDVIIERTQVEIQSLLKEIIDSEWYSSRPFFYDIMPGVEIVIVPVVIKGKPESFLWAGMMVDKESLSLIKDYLISSYGKKADWEYLLEQTLSAQEAKEQGITNKLNNLSKLVASHIDKGVSQNAYKKQISLFQRAAQIEIINEQLLQGFMESISECDFFGMARRKTQGEYEVAYAAGEGSHTLKHSCFESGEGLLGQSLQTGKPVKWEDIEKDPRAYFFHKHGIHPRSLFCFPVKINGSIHFLLFGGSFSRGELSKEVFETGEALTSILENNYLPQ